MRRSYANFWSHAAARLTMIAHTEAAMIRWGVLLLLVALWMGFGVVAFSGRFGLVESIYRALGAFSMSDDYFGIRDEHLNYVRFAALAVPIVGLLFAFSGAFGQHLARAFNGFAAHHVVIAGDTPAALSLALDCRLRNHDAVILIAQDLTHDTALGLRRRGVIVVEGDATRLDTLKNARAHHAAHVVAFEPDDTVNLQIEAAVRRLVGNKRRKEPIGVHVSTRSPMLLKEAREMRSAQARASEAANRPPALDPKPFSLDEMAARELIQKQAQEILDVADKLKLEHLHLVFFGFCPAAAATAERMLMSLWSARFGPPRITVLTPGAESVGARFKARHREAFAYPQVWAADIAFLEFDWDETSVDHEVLDRVEQERGKPCAAIVSAGADPSNIHLALGLKRICNTGLRWPIPIFMKESAISEFSQQYAHGDDTVEFDAYLQAFGAHQVIATRAKILDGVLDRGAAVAHEHYKQKIGERTPMNIKELQAAMRDWDDVLETYRAANRAVSDAALVKVWDAGWRPAAKGAKGETQLKLPDDKLDVLAQTEHDRWMAERLLAGWRPTNPGEARNNELMAHNKLVSWDALNEQDRENDVVQVRAALDIARVMNPQGFTSRA